MESNGDLWIRSLFPLPLRIFPAPPPKQAVTPCTDDNTICVFTVTDAETRSFCISSEIDNR